MPQYNDVHTGMYSIAAFDSLDYQPALMLP